MPWYVLVLLAVGSSCVGIVLGLVLWRLDHPRPRRPGVSMRLAARLGGAVHYLRGNLIPAMNDGAF